MERSVSILIYFYMFICVSLLVFNLAYIFRSKGRDRKRMRLERKWLKEMEQEWEQVAAGSPVSQLHMERLERKLRNVDILIPYHEAVQKGMNEYSDGRVQQYLDLCCGIFQKLAVAYGKKTAMERAYFAYLLAEYRPNREESGKQFSIILQTYFEDSTVFCRENTLRAIYVSGEKNAVIHAYDWMNEHDCYHHSRLLSDGLALYTGDHRQLAWALWKRCRAWDSTFQVAVVQFAATISDEFSERFLEALQDNDADLELRYAILRYFRRWHFHDAKQTLIKLLTERENDLAIVAATALSNYQGEDTVRALKAALCSRNWHVRHNAAESLVSLGADLADLEQMRDLDRYGAEMLEYVMERSGKTKKAALDTQRKAVMA